MPFIKGNKLWDNPKTLASQFKKEVSVSAQTQFPKGHIPWNKGLPGYNAGSSNPSWKGGLKFRKKQDERGDSAYCGFAKTIKKRDKQCQLKDEKCCGYLVVHHIKSWRDYPDLRYELLNGITLCQAHHPRKRAEEKRLMPILQELVAIHST